MFDTLLVTAIRADGRHGVLAVEREKPQPFEVDLEMEVDLRRAGKSDLLEDTVDYSQVTSEVVSIVGKSTFALLERLADEIASRVLEFGGVLGVTVTVKKLLPPMPETVGCVAARIHRTARRPGLARGGPGTLVPDRR